MTLACPHCKDAYREFRSLHDWMEHMMRFHDDLMRKRGFIGVFATDELIVELLVRVIEHPDILAVVGRAIGEAPIAKPGSTP